MGRFVKCYPPLALKSTPLAQHHLKGTESEEHQSHTQWRRETEMKILILALLVLGAAAWPDPRRPRPRDRPFRPPFGQFPPPPPREEPPFRPDDMPMWGDEEYPEPAGGDEEWLPPFDEPDMDAGWGPEEEPMWPEEKPPCDRPGRPGGDEDNEIDPFGPDFEGSTSGPGLDGRGDRFTRRSPVLGEQGPGSDRPRGPQRGGQRFRQRPDRPQRRGQRRPGGRQRPGADNGLNEGGRRNRGRRPNRGPFGAGRRNPFFGGKPLNPEEEGQREFYPIFKADNITVENATDLPLKEGDNTFLLPTAMRRPRGRGPEKADPNAPQNFHGGFGGFGYGGLVPYLTLKYNPSSTPTCRIFRASS
ncbi:hypothetical protein AGOR_G00191390 [Albula goreensis]|uniref:Uncharacterized protein n=1 Tax=Albula goreensis TaxID=1534307 RepID=A0A8T3CQZ7_9TELE|nr:hypothetical protein AGOR_G00191390 [Albula goreensis]